MSWHGWLPPWFTTYRTTQISIQNIQWIITSTLASKFLFRMYNTIIGALVACSIQVVLDLPDQDSWLAPLLQEMLLFSQWFYNIFTTYLLICPTYSLGGNKCWWTATLWQQCSNSTLTLKVLVMTIDAQWEGMGDVGSARYEPALLPPCPTIRVLS